MITSCLFAATTLLLLAADPPKPETLPPPRALEILPGPVAPPMTGFYRQSAYARWNYVAPNRQGVYMPIVYREPGFGAYYLISGYPYPYLPLHQAYVLPTISGTPYQLPPQRFPPQIIIIEPPKQADKND